MAYTITHEPTHPAHPYLLEGRQGTTFPVAERYETLGAARGRVIMLQRADAQMAQIRGETK